MLFKDGKMITFSSKKINKGPSHQNYPIQQEDSQEDEHPCERTCQLTFFGPTVITSLLLGLFLQFFIFKFLLFAFLLKFLVELLKCFHFLFLAISGKLSTDSVFLFLQFIFLFFRNNSCWLNNIVSFNIDFSVFGSLSL